MKRILKRTGLAAALLVWLAGSWCAGTVYAQARASTTGGVVTIRQVISGTLSMVNNSVLSIVQGTITADAQAISTSATWNNAGVTFTGWKENITDTASNAASLLLNLAKANTSQFSVDKNGNVVQLGTLTLPNGTVGTPSVNLGDPATGFMRPALNNWRMSVNGAGVLDYYSGGQAFSSTTGQAWSNGAIGGTIDFRLLRGGSGSLSITDTTNTAQIGVTGDGIFRLCNSGCTDFARLQFGGTTSSFPALKRSSTALQCRLADDSGDCEIDASQILLSNSKITSGSGTGISVVATGLPEQVVYKVTIDKSAFICAATTCDVTIATLPAKTFVSHALADLTTTFACTATCTTATLSATLGKTAGGNQYLLSFDADAATAQFGDAAAELGASLAPSTTPTLVGDVASWTTTTAVVMRLTSGTGNIGNASVSNLSQGSVTFYLTTTRFP